MALGFASALAAGGFEVAKGFVEVGYDDSQVEAGLARTEATVERGSGLFNKFALGFGLLGAAAIKFGVEFDDRMAHVQAQLRVSNEMTAQWKAGLLSISQDTGKGTNELADALLTVGRNGLRGAQALNVVRDSAEASAVGLGKTADVAKLASQVMNIWGKDTYSAAQILDVFTAAAEHANIAPAQLGLTLGRVGPLAAKLGVSFTDLAAGAAALARDGVPARSVMTGLNALFSAILNPTKKEQAALASVDLSATKLHDTLKNQGLLATLDLLQTSFGGNVTMLNRVFGSASKLDAVLALSSQHGTETAKVYSDVANSAGDLADSFNRVDETTEHKLLRAFASLKVFLTQIGTQMLPLVRGAATVFLTLAGAIDHSHTAIVGISNVLKILIALWIAGRIKALAIGAAAKISAADTETAAGGMVVSWEKVDGAMVATATQAKLTGAAMVGAIGGAEVAAVGARGKLAGLTTSLGSLAGKVFTFAIVADIIANYLPNPKKGTPQPFKSVPLLGGIADKAFGYGYDVFGNPGVNSAPVAKNPAEWLAAIAKTRQLTSSDVWPYIQSGQLGPGGVKALKKHIDPRIYPAALAYAESLHGGPPLIKPTTTTTKTTPLFAHGQTPVAPFSIRNNEALANQTPGQSDDAAAQQAEIKYWKWVLSHKKLNQAQTVAVNQALGSAENTYYSIEQGMAAKARAAAARAAAARKRLLEAETKIPAGLVVNYDKARGNDEQLKALDAEKAWLEGRIASKKFTGSWLEKLTKALRIIDKNIQTTQDKIATTIPSSISAAVSKGAQDVSNAKGKSTDQISKALNADKAALLNERKFIEAQIASHKYHGDLLSKLRDELTSVDGKLGTVRSKIAAIQKKKLASFLVIPAALKIGVDKAEIAEAAAQSTKNYAAEQTAYKQEIDALTAEETLLKTRIASHRVKGASLAKLYDTLRDVDQKIATTREKYLAQQNILAQQKLAFATARTGFFGQFAPDVYRRTPGGALALGSAPNYHSKTVHVTQNFTSPPASHFTNFRNAKYAAEASFGGR